MKNPFSRTRSPSTGNAPTDTLLTVVRALGLASLRLRVVAFTLLSLVAGLCQAVLLVVISEVAVAGVQGKDSFHAFGVSLSLTNALIVAFGALAVFFASSMSSALIATSVSTEALTVARTRVVTGFFRSNWSVQSAERLGHVQQLLTMNSQATANVVANVSSALQSLLMVCAILTVALVVDPLAAIGVMSVGVVLSQMLRPINKRSRQATRDLSHVTRAMAIQVTEYTRLSRDFRLYGVESRALDRLYKMINDAGRVYRRSQMLVAVTPILYQTAALGFVIIAITLLTGAGHAKFAELGAILLLMLRAVAYGASVQSSIQGLRASQGMLEDVTFELRRYDDSRARVGELEPESFVADFDAVDYSYDGVTPALSAVNIHIPQGKIIGVLGPSGSGKTTISQLLLGLREPTSGRVTIGAEDAAMIRKSDAHSTVALVPQEPVLLRGSIIDNIKFLRDFGEHEVVEASTSAHLHEDVEKMPAGYDTSVGEGGNALSGGQKQRLAIARALIGSPKLIVLDEPTSAVDGRTERLIGRTLAELRGHVTVVIISHRLDTTAHCDMLLVLSNGRVADYGERDTVMAGSAYRNIVLNRRGIKGDHPSDAEALSGDQSLEIEPSESVR